MMIKLIVLAVMVLIHAQNVGGDWECDATEWHFVLHEYVAPEVYVRFEDGHEITVPLDGVTGNTAHYYAPLYSESNAIVDVWTYVPDGWTGNFVISHGPCPDGTAVTIADWRVLPDFCWALLAVVFVPLVLLIVVAHLAKWGLK